MFSLGAQPRVWVPSCAFTWHTASAVAALMLLWDPSRVFAGRIASDRRQDPRRLSSQPKVPTPCIPSISSLSSLSSHCLLYQIPTIPTIPNMSQIPSQYSYYPPYLIYSLSPPSRYLSSPRMPSIPFPYTQPPPPVKNAPGSGRSMVRPIGSLHGRCNDHGPFASWSVASYHSTLSLHPITPCSHAMLLLHGLAHPITPCAIAPLPLTEPVTVAPPVRLTDRPRQCASQPGSVVYPKP